MILEIDLHRYVSKKYFREALGISPAQLSNWINRSHQVSIKKFDEIGIELIDLDRTSEYWTGSHFAYHEAFVKRDGKIRLLKRENEIHATEVK